MSKNILDNFFYLYHRFIFSRNGFVCNHRIINTDFDGPTNILRLQAEHYPDRFHRRSRQCQCIKWSNHVDTNKGFCIGVQSKFSPFRDLQFSFIKNLANCWIPCSYLAEVLFVKNEYDLDKLWLLHVGVQLWQPLHCFRTFVPVPATVALCVISVEGVTATFVS